MFFLSSVLVVSENKRYADSELVELAILTQHVSGEIQLSRISIISLKIIAFIKALLASLILRISLEVVLYTKNW